MCTFLYIRLIIFCIAEVYLHVWSRPLSLSLSLSLSLLPSCMSSDTTISVPFSLDKSKWYKIINESKSFEIIRSPSHSIVGLTHTCSAWTSLHFFFKHLKYNNVFYELKFILIWLKINCGNCHLFVTFIHQLILMHYISLLTVTRLRSSLKDSAKR